MPASADDDDKNRSVDNDKGKRAEIAALQGANIHIISGMGTTNDNGNPSGLGNLIIGYDEGPDVLGFSALNAGDRGGSHNLIIGRGNRFTNLAFGGLVAGELNTISAEGNTVSGGFNNTAGGQFTVVIGGQAFTDNRSFSIAPNPPFP
ncbi:MAG: hypothetical protein WB586_31185 [Chthoniobacterales bacterium]